MGAVMQNRLTSATTQGPQSLKDFGPIGIKAQGLNQVHHTASLAGRSIPTVLVMTQYGQGEKRQLLGAQPKTEGNRQLVALG
jgi:hypothetical protein